ncbi:hypothetical protein PAXINDRAFT_104069, partial [Paxillus involutus ATCC 200175]
RRSKNLNHVFVDQRFGIQTTTLAVIHSQYAGKPSSSAQRVCIQHSSQYISCLLVISVVLKGGYTARATLKN